MNYTPECIEFAKRAIQGESPTRTLFEFSEMVGCGCKVCCELVPLARLYIPLRKSPAPALVLPKALSPILEDLPWRPSGTPTAHTKTALPTATWRKLNVVEGWMARFWFWIRGRRS